MAVWVSVGSEVAEELLVAVEVDVDVAEAVPETEEAVFRRVCMAGQHTDQCLEHVVVEVAFEVL